MSNTKSPRSVRREARALECLDAIRLAVEGASNDIMAVRIIRTILADAPAPDRRSTASVARLLRAIKRVRPARFRAVNRA